MARNWTAEILKQIAQGRVAVNSVGPATLVRYEPRSKFDPRPWTDGTYRAGGRYVHTVEACGQKLHLFPSGALTHCVLPKGHQDGFPRIGAHRSTV